MRLEMNTQFWKPKKTAVVQYPKVPKYVYHVFKPKTVKGFKFIYTKIRQTTGEHLGHLKDLEISKYKRSFSLERPWTI
jgi:hypothetical protein